MGDLLAVSGQSSSSCGDALDGVSDDNLQGRNVMLHSMFRVPNYDCEGHRIRGKERLCFPPEITVERS